MASCLQPGLLLPATHCYCLLFAAQPATACHPLLLPLVCSPACYYLLPTATATYLYAARPGESLELIKFTAVANAICLTIVSHGCWVVSYLTAVTIMSHGV